MKKLVLILFIVMSTMILAACDTKPVEKLDVSLTIWASELEETLTEGLIDGFVEHYKDEANLTVSYGPQSEAQAADSVLADLEAAADVFIFASDQFKRLMDAGALQEVLENKNAVVEANGGAQAGSVLAATQDGKLYAYPMSADNGYFLYYDKSVYTENDVKTLDGILAKAQADGSKFTMQINNGWYLYSFFGGAGLPVSFNGTVNSVDWNNTKGLQVAKSLLALQAHPGYVNLTDAEFSAGVGNGTVSAGVNGTWNATAVSAAFGDNYAATKLPTYTLNGEQVQMSSFAGYKLAGVNKTTDQPYWSMKLAEWVTSYDAQVARFESNGVGPSNVAASLSEEVQANPAIAAIAQQGAYAVVQNVGDNFWSPSESFGNLIVTAELTVSSTDAQIQGFLDQMVAGIEAAPLD